LTVQDDLKGRTSEELDRDLAEVSMDIEFLTAQVKLDMESYSPDNLEAAYGKISEFDRKRKLIEFELQNRNLHP
jgi:hypothetical protein